MNDLKVEFLNKFKKALIEVEQNQQEGFKGHGYFVTMEQLLQENHKNSFLEDIYKYDCAFHYHPDKTHGYTDGYFTMELNERGNNVELDYHYRIELGFDDRYDGYCACTPDMKGYNETRHCCGENCDWTAPSIAVIKKEYVTYFNFKGKEKSLWEAEHKWEEENQNFKRHRLKSRLDRIEESLTLLNADKERIQKEMEELN